MPNAFASTNVDELVPIYVRRQHYLAVFRFAAALDESDSDNPTPNDEPRTPLAIGPREALLHNGWKRSEFPILRSKSRPDSSGMILLELAYAEPGRRIGFDDIVQASSGKSHKQVKAELAVLSRTIHSVFGQNRGWPLHWATAPDGVGTVYYASQELADAWNDR